MTGSELIPKDLHYSKDHEWVRVEGITATVGITHHAQQALGDVTYVDLPRVGKSVRQFGELAAVESAKAASDIFSPLSGTVTEVNSSLDSAPEKVNSDPYGAGWICKLNVADAAELGALMDAAAYSKMLEGEQH